jgi:hypothetical protein
MNPRPLDANEARYVTAKWRELRRTNRIMSVGFYTAAWCWLPAAVLAVWVEMSRRHPSGFWAAIQAALCFGAAYVFSFAAARASASLDRHLPTGGFTQELLGTFSEQTSARGRYWHFIGDRLVSLPPYWSSVLKRTDGSQVFAAEGIQGPGDEFIVVAIDDRLSVSRDVDRGLLLVMPSMLPVAGTFLFVALALTAMVTGLTYQRDLTLYRYMVSGRHSLKYSSVAGFKAATPSPFVLVTLDKVVIGTNPQLRPVALDEPPVPLAEATNLQTETDHLIVALEDFDHTFSNPNAPPNLDAVKGDDRLPELEKSLKDLQRVMKHPSMTPATLEAWRAPRALFTAMLARRAGRLLDKAKFWAERIKADSGERGIAITGATQLHADLVSALQQVEFFAGSKDDPDPPGRPFRSPAELKLFMNSFRESLSRPDEIMRKRQSVNAIILPQAKGPPALAIGAEYPIAALSLQAAMVPMSLAMLALIVVGTARAVRLRPVVRRVRAALPKTL